MTSGNSWIFGSDSSCDVVVDEVTVSARHCKLTMRDSGYDLEDLGSTNGTYVNGQKITGIRRVTSADKVTFGQTVLLPWARVEPSQRVLTIGRAEDNDIVFSHETVSGHHARLVIDGKTATLEDLNSSNGTAIGTPQNRISSSPIRPGDIIYFGTHRVPAASLLGSNSDIDATFVVDGGLESLSPTSSGELSVLIRRWGPLAGVVALILIVAGVALPRIFNTRESVVNTPENKSDIATKNPVSDSPQVLVPTKPKVDPSSQFNIEDAIFSLVVCDAEQTAYQGLGSAWAVSKNQVVTSATVVKLLEEAQKDHPRVVIYSDKLSNGVLKVQGSHVHPEFEKIYAQFQDVNDQIAEKNAALESATEETQLTDLQKELVQLGKTRFLLMDQMTFYDIAVLDVSGSLPRWLEINEFPTSKTASMHGAPLDAIRKENRGIDLTKPLDRMHVECQIKGKKLLSKEPGAPSRLVIDTAGKHAEYIWTGSPIVCNQKVVAIYSKPSFSPDFTKLSAVRHDATVIRRLREIAPNLFN